MSNLKANVKNTNTFQGMIIDGKVSNTKAIIIALLKTESNIPNITTPDEYKNTLINVFDTSKLIQNKKQLKKGELKHENFNSRPNRLRKRYSKRSS